MNTSKPAYTSLTIQSALAILLVELFQHFALDDPGRAATASAFLLVQLGLVAVNIFGRVRAEDKIDLP